MFSIFPQNYEITPKWLGQPPNPQFRNSTPIAPVPCDSISDPSILLSPSINKKPIPLYRIKDNIG